MRKEIGSSAFSTLSLPITALLFVGSFVLPSFNLSRSQAQAASPITPSGLHTQVNLSPTPPAGQTQYDITGGTRPGGGTNLFHSFGDFSVPTNNIANFLNAGSIDLNGNPLAPNLPTSNILGRVTGGDPSAIFGMIQTNGPNGFGTANLFLMNPAGFLFGPNATVDVGGMMTFTTADYLRFQGTDTLFNKVSTTESLNPLSTVPVAAFGFLGSNPAAIAVQGSILKVAPGQSISLVGGNRGFEYIDPDTGNHASASVPGGVTMTGGKLSALGGQINIASVASAGEILVGTFTQAPNTNGQSFTTMGNITLSHGATLDVSGNAAGTVRIRGGQFVIADATLSADTGNAKGASAAIDINVTGDMSITDTRGVPAITARTLGSGDPVEIRISSGNLTATSSFVDPSFLPTTLIDSHTAGTGKAGSVSITTGDLSVSGLAGTPLFTFIDSGTTGPGNGGDVTITARDIQTNTTTFVSTGDSVANKALPGTSGVTGSAGNVTITTDSLQLGFTIIDTNSTAAGSKTQQAGNVSITAHDINIVQGQINTIGNARGGTITINADRIVTEATIFETDTVFGPGGGITVIADVVELTNGSTLVSQTFGDGNAGGIQVTAHDHVSLLGPTSSSATGTFRPSGLFSNSLAFVGTHGGDAGNIVVTTPRLELTGGRINTSTETGGHGGNVTINANVISMSGEFANPDTAEPIYQITDIHPSGIFTKTVGNEFCGGPCGGAGNISITTGSLVMGSGSQIDSGTSSTGKGGDIVIHATNQISMSGTLSNGDPVGIFSRTIGAIPDANSGGDISLTAEQSVTISDGASVSASSTGPGNTGNIQINAGNQFAMTNSSVITEANQSSGGSIKITTAPSGTVQLTDSGVSASVLDGTGGGGSVNIDPQVVILQNSQILAQAVRGPGGNILITTNLLLPDTNSLISASSQFGVNGTVTIQSPNSPASGKIQPLGNELLETTSLLNQRCAALAGGEFSSFTVAGRDSLPTEPGSWLPSPLVAFGAGEALGVWGEGVTLGASFATERTLLSLRQIAPTGFLTQAFAQDWSAGCQS